MGDSSEQPESISQSGPNSVAESQAGDKKDKHKVDIFLKPTGNAPIMKKKRWAVDSDKQLSWILDFMKKYLKIDPSENLYLYVNQSFAPSPDQIVKNLYDCYSTEGKLVLHYCTTQAWG